LSISAAPVSNNYTFEPVLDTTASVSILCIRPTGFAQPVCVFANCGHYWPL